MIVRSAHLLAAVGIVPILGSANLLATGINSFAVAKLVSDIPGLADYTDSNLVNPWGVASSPTSPFWVANNGTGVATLYNGQGQALPLIVAIPPPAAGGQPAPTASLFNGGNSFQLAPGQPARFLFASEEGVISGWAPVMGNNGFRAVDRPGSVYKGLALGNNGSGDFLYAANFASGQIDVFDSAFSSASLAGSFTDPNLPSGFAPFNIQNIGGQLYVTYAKKGAGSDDQPGAGNGYISVFDVNGNLVRRLVTGGALNSPWGLEVAPADFGPFAGDLLVGNFGDGRINVYDPLTGNFLDSLKDSNGDPLAIEGLWSLKTGNGGSGGDLNKVYFSAGIPGDGVVEDHGLFGALSPAETNNHVPDAGASTALLLGVSAAGLAAAGRKR